MLCVNFVYYSEMWELLSSGTWQRSRKLNTMYTSEGEASSSGLISGQSGFKLS